MIDIHFPELLAAAGIFLFTLLCLNRILFRPAVRVIEERQKLTAGRLEEADQLLRRCEQLAQEYETRIRDEKFQNYRAQDERRGEALGRRAEMLAETRKQADRMIADARSDVALQLEKVKAGLQREAREIASAITSRLLGRNIQ